MNEYPFVERTWRSRLQVRLARWLCRGTRYHAVFATHEVEGAWECLNMIHDEFVNLGLPMEGCPPMFYNDALRSVASRLGRYGGLERWNEVRAAISGGYDAAASRGARLRRTLLFYTDDARTNP